MKINFREITINKFGSHVDTVFPITPGKHLITGSNGDGKCLGIDTPVLMYDGTVKKVQDIVVGDLLVGPDSKPRKVISTTKGEDELYRIVPIKGDAWVCNSKHELTLKTLDGEIFESSVEDFLQFKKTKQHTSYLFRVGVDHFNSEVKFDPYWVGLWLGDGSVGTQRITNNEPELDAYYREFSEKLGLKYTSVSNSSGCPTHNFVGTKKIKNPLLDFCRDSLYENESKKIPQEYLTSSIKNRLEILAGLIDSDGYLNKTAYEIITKYDDLRDDILFLGRSLGFRCISSKKIGKIKSTGFEGEYWRISIVGRTDEIPVRLSRKRSDRRKVNSDFSKTSFQIDSLGVGEYYGFELEGDGRFLLGDFTVTHNSTIMEALVSSIFKTTRHKDPTHNHAGDACVTSKFDINENQYEIRRYWHSNDKIKSPQLFCNDEEIGLRRSTETEKEILNVIKLPYDLFTMVIVVLQGLPSNFCSLGPTIRKTIVETLFGDQVWDEYRKLFAQAMKVDKAKGSSVQLDFSGKKEQMISLNSRIETAKEMEGKSDDDYKQEIITIKKALSEVGSRIEEFKTNNSQFLNEGEEIRLRDKMDVLKDSRDRITTRQNELKKVVDTGKCYACERDYPHVMMDSAQKELEFLVPKYEKTQDIYAQTRNTFHECTKIKQDLDLLQSQFNMEKQRLNDKAASNGTQKIDYSVYEKDLLEITATVSGLNEQLNTLNSALDHLGYIDSLLKPSSKFRTETLRDRIGCINKIIESITPLIFTDIECQLSLESTGLEIDLKRGHEKLDYKEFSGGERRRIDLIMIFSFQKFIQESSGVSSNLLVFDEIFEHLDAEGVESTLNCIESLFPEATCIYVVTHQQNIKSHFNSVVSVTKENGVSSVSCAGGS